MPTVLLPDTEIPFGCIGPACTLSCCKMWNITLDAKNVRWLHAHSHYSSVARLLELISAYQHSASNRLKEMVIQLDEQGRCPMLNEQGLCSMQIEAGEQALSHTCRVYPRICNKINGVLEISYHLSCPEAARLLLSPKQGIAFKKTQTEWTEGFNTNIITDNVNNRPAIRYTNSIRSLLLMILKDRRFSLDIRILFAGLWLKRIAECTQVLEIQKINSSFETMFAQNDIASLFTSIEPDMGTMLLFVQELSSLNRSPSLTEYNDLFHQANLALFDNALGGITTASYELNRNTYYDIQDLEHILENYMVMYAWSHLAPFTIDMDVWRSYLHMVAFYILTKYGLVAITALNKELTEDSMTYALCILYRVFMHSDDLRRNMALWMDDNGLNSVPILASLVLA